MKHFERMYNPFMARETSVEIYVMNGIDRLADACNFTVHRLINTQIKKQIFGPLFLRLVKKLKKFGLEIYLQIN